MLRSQEWLKPFHQVLEEEPNSYKLNNKILAKKLDISERGLFRKAKRLTGHSPQQLIRRHQLKQALDFLKTGKYKTVKELGSAVGYSNISYFSTQFEKEHGKKPFDLLKQKGWR